jgi:probable phosphoglycerate mutase
LATNKTIYLIRHGQTDYNLKGIVQGSGIDSDLNAFGRKQAEAFYQTYRHIPFDHIYTSELKRTWQSVDPFVKAGRELTRLKALNEINWGVFEGRPSTPESRVAFNKVVTSWKEGSVDVPIEGGESPLAMYERQKPGWEAIKSSTYSNILVCMHGRAMRSFLSLMLNTSLTEMDQYPHTNLCLYVLDVINGEAKLVRKNDVTHLATLS